MNIKPKVSKRILTKADRLFTGSLEGRIIEILQNARRAGATEVTILNKDGYVTVTDNGSGIEDFSKLLELGGSGWDDMCEQSEDPAVVGLFCLAPRELTVRSKGKMAIIKPEGWTEAPTEILDDPDPVFSGTVLAFQDKEWAYDRVDKNAVYCGMKVTVNGKECSSYPFTSEKATHFPELGCKIMVLGSSEYHSLASRIGFYHEHVRINFFGQVVPMDFDPIPEMSLRYMIDMTGEATGIRMMLPARTRLVENDAYKQLQAAVEMMAYRHIKEKGRHKLSYRKWLRAKELGVELPEAEPTYDIGLIFGDSPGPVEVSKPTEFPLERCYRSSLGDEEEENAHLLAALGNFKKPFIPVNISNCYDGYSWAKLPEIEKVEVKCGKLLKSDYVWKGDLTAYEEITITVHTTDGKVFSSAVPMAVETSFERVMVTPAAERELCNTEICFHLGGYSDDCCESDSYERQQHFFNKDIEQFWADLKGPNENMRLKVVKACREHVRNWKEINVNSDGHLRILFEDGTEQVVTPAQADAA